jgi:diacylglycerol kinase family enzyme
LAGELFLTPKAIVNDSLLDVDSIDKLNLTQRFKILLKVPKGEHQSDKKVKYYQTKKIDLKFDQKVIFHVDGELYFSSKFGVNIISEAIKIIYTPKGNHFFK